MEYFAGCREIQVPEKQGGTLFPTLVLYPTIVTSRQEAFGPFQMEVAREAAPADGIYPLVVISHGSGGTHLTHRTLAVFLAKQGFVVALPLHPGNNRFDNSREYTFRNMAERPGHISAVIDAISGDPGLNSVTQTDRTTIIGHSVGGYTALALAGASPHTGFLCGQCQRPPSPEEPYWIPVLRRNEVPNQLIPVEKDVRVVSIVLLAPDVSLFMHEGALDGVRVPVLARTAEHDFAPSETLEVLVDNLGEGVYFQGEMIPKAGHYSFLSPFPEAMRARVGPAGSDREGFSREAFHQELYRDILTFLKKTQ